MMTCASCKRPRWDLHDGTNVFCLFEGSDDCQAFARDNPSYQLPAPREAPRVSPGVRLSDEEAKVAALCAHSTLRALRAQAVEGRVEEVLHRGRIEAVEDLLATLNARLSLLCSGCGTGPEHACKMDCDVRRRRPTPTRATDP